jgi:hypothetical protein
MKSLPLPTGNDQLVQRWDWEAVPNGNRERVPRHEIALGEVAENATLLSQGVGGSEAAKIRVVASALVRIALPAKCLEVLSFITSANLARHYVVDVQGPFVSRDSA